ncbi:MAG TPA: choice-of-anchor E domain-containing protein [Candidatus Methylacidiphilales bacterium]|jgi:hypothetical protein|nr:choice-of-anchor E domain-containing protein [Candidatus Methylacidiphilales bacterium]
MSQSIRYSLFKIAFSCTAALLLFTDAASAKTQTETFTASESLGCSQSDNNFVLPGFNTTLGTLDCIDVTLTFSGRSSIRVINDGSAPLGFSDASLTVPIDVSGPDGIDFDTSLTGDIASGTAKPGLNSFKTMKNSVTDSQQINPGAYNLWENQPDNLVSFIVSKGDPTYQGADHGGDLFFGGKATEHGKISVEYIYTVPNCLGTGGAEAVPEPPGKYFSGIVAVALMLVLIRRKKLLST